MAAQVSSDATGMLVALVLGMVLGAIIFALGYLALTYAWPWETLVY